MIFRFLPYTLDNTICFKYYSGVTRSVEYWCRQYILPPIEKEKLNMVTTAGDEQLPVLAVILGM